MQSLQSPKGTRDLYPADYAITEHIVGSWQKVCRTYGFEKYDGPMFEHLDLYTQKSGDEIEKQLYSFKDKGGRDLALRPEITPTLARMVAARGSSLKMPLRWYSIPNLFRYERMQKGRLREFMQLNMDIIGIPGVTADAELIAAAIAMMRDLGFNSDDFSVKISSRTLLEELLLAVGVEKKLHAGVYAILDHRHKIGEDEFSKELNNTLGSEQLASGVTGILGMKKLELINSNFPGLPSVASLEKLFGLLDMYGLSSYAEFDIGIVRGLAYYTGIVFELFDKLRSMRAIAGGGRYDKLIALYGGPDTPAVGFAAGDVVLSELMAAKSIKTSLIPRSLVFVVSLTTNTNQETISIAQNFRENGISCEFALKEMPVGKQLKSADACGARFAVFAGGDEARNGMVKIKDMKSGDEILCPVQNSVDELRRKIA
jgi:histidyl-tRNA synthetase